MKLTINRRQTLGPVQISMEVKKLLAFGISVLALLTFLGHGFPSFSQELPKKKSEQFIQSVQRSALYDRGIKSVPVST